MLFNTSKNENKSGRDPVVVSVFLEAVKTAEGAILPEAEFSFGVYNQADKLVVTASNQADGTIKFPAILFKSAGTFHYTIKEITASNEKWITDESVFPVTITITKHGSSLEAEVDYPSGEAKFVNIFRETEKCSVIGHQTVEVCVPVSVKPFAEVGKINIICCEKPLITSDSEECRGEQEKTCDFTIKQKICIEVPIEFGAEVNTEEAFIECNSASTEEEVKDNE